jgi:hypothetical protein
VLKVSDAKLNTKLAAQVATWSKVLSMNEKAATAEAARLQVY